MQMQVKSLSEILFGLSQVPHRHFAERGGGSAPTEWSPGMEPPGSQEPAVCSQPRMLPHHLVLLWGAQAMLKPGFRMQPKVLIPS